MRRRRRAAEHRGRGQLARHTLDDAAAHRRRQQRRAPRRSLEPRDPLEDLLLVGVAAEDVREVEHERDAVDRHRARRAAARARRASVQPCDEDVSSSDVAPDARSTSREQARTSADGPAVQDGLGRGHGDDEIGLDERGGDPERPARDRAELDEVARPRRRGRSAGRGSGGGTPAARGARSRAARGAGRGRRRRGSSRARRRAARAPRRSPRSPPGAGRARTRAPAGAASRSRPWPCRRASRARPAAAPESGKRSASRVAAPTRVQHVRRRRRPQDDAALGHVDDRDPASRRGAGCGSRAAAVASAQCHRRR